MPLRVPKVPAVDDDADADAVAVLPDATGPLGVLLERPQAESANAATAASATEVAIREVLWRDTHISKLLNGDQEVR
jgi:hypothetical protein